jgi:SAM-dependent methyltransferase
MTDRATQDNAQLREAVRQRYASAAIRVAQEHAAAESGLVVLETGSCCGGPADTGSGSNATSNSRSVITSDLYAIHEIDDLPSAAVLASLGCGNPTALAELQPGETVLDLGSGGGIDVLLSARRVGPTGFAYGLDMTDEMLALAEENRQARGVANVRFLKGHIEDIPLPNNSVDVIISNCVINLSGDKPGVLREAFRVLKPGGRFAVSDVVVQGDLPDALRQSMELWAGCIAGALDERKYRQLLSDAGFLNVGIEVTRTYDPQDLAASECCDSDSAASRTGFSELQASGGRLVSAFIRAMKPAADQHAAHPQALTSAPAGFLSQSECCSTTEQASCCSPTDKAACCEAVDASSSTACGCR